MFCVGAGRRVIMSHCYSRHSSTICTPSLCRVSLHPAHPIPGISHPARSPPRVYPRSLDPRATRHGAVRRVERLCFYLRRRAILWTLSQRHNHDVLHAVMGERKKEVTATFRPVSQNGDKNDVRPLSQSPAWALTNGIIDESFKRECYRDFLSKRVSPARVFYPIKCAQTEGLRATCFYVFFSGESLRLVYLV